MTPRVIVLVVTAGRRQEVDVEADVVMMGEGLADNRLEADGDVC